MSLKELVLKCLTSQERLQRNSLLRRLLWRRSKSYRLLEQRAEHMREKEVITVAFMVLNLSCWKCDSLFRLMLQHPRFRPIIWIVPELQIKNANEHQRNLEQMRKFFADSQYLVAEMYTLEQMREEYAPDIVFLAKPYVGITPWDVWNMKKELVCYVPYCYQNTNKEDFLCDQLNHVWRNLYATKRVKKLASNWMANGGCNVVTSGAPFADAFLYHSSDTGMPVWKACGQGLKKIIWAPHWTVMGDSWFKVSTFLNVADGMLQLAEKYADRVQWAFKPHPLLRDTLYQHPDWGKERTDAYYGRWESMPNTQLETGAYVELFKQSDAMVHDSGSFIMEYLLVDKPCMYLQLEGSSVDFNEDTQRALDCYRKGKSIADVEAFLLDLLQGTPDAMARPRVRYRKNSLIPPRGKTAAQNIIDVILNGR